MTAFAVGRRCSTLLSMALAAVLGGASGPALAAAQNGAATRPGNVTIYLAPASKAATRSASVRPT
jgi:hypothetical protein